MHYKTDKSLLKTFILFYTTIAGGAASLGLELLRVALKFSDGVGDHNNITVCQKTGGNFEFVENPCSIFMVASASYDMDPYRFMIPHSGSKVGLT